MMSIQRWYVESSVQLSETEMSRQCENEVSFVKSGESGLRTGGRRIVKRARVDDLETIWYDTLLVAYSANTFPRFHNRTDDCTLMVG